MMMTMCWMGVLELRCVPASIRAAGNGSVDDDPIELHAPAANVTAAIETARRTGMMRFRLFSFNSLLESVGTIYDVLAPSSSRNGD